MTTDVNIGNGEPFDVYIGRQRGPKMWRGGYYIPRSDWANPLKVGIDGTRDLALAFGLHFDRTMRMLELHEGVWGEGVRS